MSVKQTVAEYYSQDGSIERAIKCYLETHPNMIIKHIGVVQHNYQGTYNIPQSGAYTLVIYEEESK